MSLVKGGMIYTTATKIATITTSRTTRSTK